MARGCIGERRVHEGHGEFGAVPFPDVPLEWRRPPRKRRDRHLRVPEPARWSHRPATTPAWSPCHNQSRSEHPSLPLPRPGFGWPGDAAPRAGHPDSGGLPSCQPRRRPTNPCHQRILSVSWSRDFRAPPPRPERVAGCRPSREYRDRPTPAARRPARHVLQTPASSMGCVQRGRGPHPAGRTRGS